MAELTLEVLNGPRPPAFNMTGNIAAIQESLSMQNEHNKQVARFQGELYNILHNGNLVRSFQVENLTADKLIAGIMAVDKIYLGDDKFELDGSLKQIRVKDNQGSPVTMVEMGTIGGSDWGLKVRNAAGAVVFQALSVAGVSMNGAIITDATIVNAQIVDINGGKVDDGTLPNAALTSVSADKITLSGTLTCTSGKTAIAVTGGGQVVLSGGGDLNFESSGTNFSYCNFKDGLSTPVLRGGLVLDTSSAYMQLASNNSYDLAIVSANNTFIQGTKIYMGAASSQDVVFNADIGSSLIPFLDDSPSCGTAGRRWTLVRGNTITSGDLRFENGITLTEPNKVISSADPNDGILMMRQDWTIVYWDHLDGTRQTTNFPPVDVPQTLVPQEDYVHDLLEELQDELPLESNGGELMRNELNDWVQTARKNRVILTDQDVESKKAEIITRHGNGEYAPEIARPKNVARRSAQLAERAIKRDERKARRR